MMGKINRMIPFSVIYFWMVTTVDNHNRIMVTDQLSTSVSRQTIIM